jgi:hypothetical protein
MRDLKRLWYTIWPAISILAILVFLCAGLLWFPLYLVYVVFAGASAGICWLIVACVSHEFKARWRNYPRIRP